MPGLLLFRGFAMRLVPSFHLSYPDVRALRIALAAGAVAGLIVIAACTDTGGKSITAPQSPRMQTSGTNSFGTHGKIILCVAASSPTGDYTFVNTRLNRSTPQDGYTQAQGWPIALTGNGHYNPPSLDLWNDGGTGGNGTANANALQGVPYTLHNTNGVAPTLGDGSGSTGCVLVIERTSGNTDFMASRPNTADPPGPCDPLAPGSSCGGLIDTFSAATITYQSANVAAAYDHTDCLLDNGVLIPQQTNPPGTFETWGNSGINFNNATPSTYVCDNHNNPTRAFANFDHGATITFAFVPVTVSECTLGYPYGTLPAKTATLFNESGALSSYGRVGDQIRVWYTDEHSLTLGVDSFFVNNKAPTLDDHGSYPIELMPTSTPLHAGKATGSPILVGSTVTTGILAALDGAGRPLHPALFITDITSDLTNTSGDWQIAGGSGISPNAVYGSWKGAVINVDNTHATPTKDIKPKADAFKNHKVVYVGAGTADGASTVNGNNPPAAVPDLGYSAELVWNISSLGLTAGRAYRLQFMVHDGDQNKTGGDVGEACLNIGPGSADPVVLINPDA
jgi:hypothetical protein